MLGAFVYFDTLLRSPGLVCSALATRFAASNCSDLVTISLYVMSSVRWGVMDFLMMSGMFLSNFLIVTSSVIDLRPCLSINLLCMLSSALPNRCTPMYLPSLLGVIVCHCFHKRSLLMNGISNFRRASMNLKKVWFFFCSSH